MKINSAPNGLRYLHIWREGTAYENEKKPLLREEWNSIKFSLQPHASTTNERVHDLRKSLPLPNDSFDAVYANHVLEHLTPEEGGRFTTDLLRVLKPGGICRIVVPDLESTCREYVRCLENVRTDRSDRNLHHYELAVLKLIDQMVRDVPGGLILPILKSRRFDVEYIRSIWGDVFSRYYPDAPQRSLREKIASHSPKELFFIALRRTQLFFWRNDPRRTREANKWMYDSFSLRQLMEKCGFQDFAVKDHASSDIPDWSRYDFDRSSEGGHPLEPSVYVEARKPATMTKHE